MKKSAKLCQMSQQHEASDRHMARWTRRKKKIKFADSLSVNAAAPLDVAKCCQESPLCAQKKQNKEMPSPSQMSF